MGHGAPCYSQVVESDHEPAHQLPNKLEFFSDHWSQKVIAEWNDYQFKLVKIKGELIWHEYADNDETFVVLEGSMGIEFRERTV